MTLKSGESGPRRDTPLISSTDDTTTAANAEATRLASQMGISTFRNNNNNNNNNPTSSELRSSSAVSASRSKSSMEMELSGVPQKFRPYSPIGSRSDVSHLTSSLSMIGTNEHEQQLPQEYDCHGQKAPYYEGPYYIKYTEDGTKIKRRWCE
jgi:hypothetical protein